MKRSIWVIVVGIWAFLLAGALFARVELDDYCFAAVVEDKGITGSLSYWYNEWAGRYSQQLLHGFFAAMEPYGTRVGVPLMLAALGLAWWYAFAYWYPRRDALLVALAFGAALAMSRPNDEPIYWLSGITSYWMPIAGWGLLVGALARRQVVLAALAAFVTVAFSEAGGVITLAGLGGLILVWRSRQRQVMVAFLAAATGFAVMYFAPGNNVRMPQALPGSHEVDATIRITVASFATIVGVSALSTVVAGLFLSGVGTIMAPRVDVQRIPSLLLILVLVSSAAIAVIGMVTGGGGLGERIMFPLTTFWLGQSFCLGALMSRRRAAWRWLALVGVLLMVHLVVQISDRADYAGRWDARHEQIMATDDVPTILGPFVEVIETGDWLTACAEAWYDRSLDGVDVRRAS